MPGRHVSALARRRALLLALPVLLLLAGCGLMERTQQVTAARHTPGVIPYAEVDLRQFTRTGDPSVVTAGTVFTVQAQGTDTLLWFEREATGRFQGALLRRGNTVYALGLEGDYRRATAAQSAYYSLYLQRWHRHRAGPASASAE